MNHEDHEEHEDSADLLVILVIFVVQFFLRSRDSRVRQEKAARDLSVDSF